MMFETKWRSHMQHVAAAIDGAFGELVSVTPTTRSPNLMAKLDPSLTPATVSAVFSWRSEMAFNHSNSRSISSGSIETAPLVSTRKPFFSFKCGELPFALRQGYQIERLCDGSLFEVKDVKSDGVSRVQVEVVQLGREPADYVGSNQ
jgi:hypothetical protein